MRTIVLDCARLADRGEAMDYLTGMLALPEWWGRNLDALYDCLTDVGEPVLLALQNREAAEETPFGRLLLRVLGDAAEENPRIRLAECGNGEELSREI